VVISSPQRPDHELPDYGLLDYGLPDYGLDGMPDDNTPLMDAAALSKARPLLWLLLTISGLVFLAVAVETLGDLADRVAEGSSAPGSSALGSSTSGSAVLTSVVIAVVLLGLMGWLIVALVREIAEWNRVIATPRAFAELTGTVTGVRKALHLPYFLSTSVQLDEPWKGHATVRLLSTNGSTAKGGTRTGEIAAVGEQLSIQLYDSRRRRKVAVAAPAGRPPHRVNLLL
jgi:hypothetical protein